MRGNIIYRTIGLFLLCVTVSLPAMAQYNSNNDDFRGRASVLENTLDGRSLMAFTGTVEALNDDGSLKMEQPYRDSITLAPLGQGWPGQSFQAMGIRERDNIVVTAEITQDFFATRTVAPLQIMVGNEDYSRLFVNPAYYAVLHDKSLRRCESCLKQSMMDYHWGNYENRQPRIFGRISAIVDEETIAMSYQGGTLLVEVDEDDIPSETPLNVDDYLVLYVDFDNDGYEKKEFEADRIIRLEK